MEGAMTVQWPRESVSQDNDLLAPAAAFLRGLAVLESDPRANDTEAEAVKTQDAFATTPYSLQLITGGTLALSRWASRTVAAIGGAGAVTGAVATVFGDLDGRGQVVLVGGASAVLAVALISIAIIVRSDVLARGTAQAAEYAARGNIAASFLHAAAKPPPPVTMPAAATTWIKRKGDDRWSEVSHFAPDTKLGIVAVLNDGNRTRMPVADIEMSVQPGIRQGR
jgi:hypothetical protein